VAVHLVKHGKDGVVMEVIKHELNVPKETKEVIDLLEAIFEKAKDGFQVSDVTDLVDEFMAAVQGADKIDDELKTKARNDAMAYLVYRVGSKF
jgi:hypothetical protein